MDVGYTPRLPPRVPPKPRTVERGEMSGNNNNNGEGGQDPVDVFCRIRPVDSLDTCITVLSATTLQLVPPMSSVNKNGCVREQNYRFKEVYGPNSSQKEIFDIVAKPLVSDLLNGKNGLMFAYGVTGSGKTYTMQGTPRDGGIIRRSLDVIFNSIDEWQAKRFVFKPDKMNGFEVQSDADAKKERKICASSGKYVGSRARMRRDVSNGSSSGYSDRVPDSTVIRGLDEDNVYSVFITYFEAYNNYMYDLLEEISDSNMTKALQTKLLREDSKRNMYVHGCNEIEVKSPEEALDLLYLGQKRRKVAHTRLNAESSRSHSIFTIRVVQAPLDENGAEVLSNAGLRISQLSLVDLAGSERTSRTGAAGLRVKEAGNINNTLMMLRTCIEVLRDNQINGANRMVPYRDSKITHYLKNYFDGEGKVKMIICVNPLSSDFEETLPVMKFAELASEVQVLRSVVRTETPIGLTPGRRRANLLFREVQRRNLAEMAAKAKEAEMKPLYTLSSDWPLVDISDEKWREVLAVFKTFLQRRIANREALLAEAKTKSETCLQQVSQLEMDNLVLKQQKISLQALYDDRDHKIRDYEARLLNSEAARIDITTKYDQLVDLYNQAVEERDLALNQGHLEKQRLKARLNTKLEQEREKQDREYKNKLKEHKQKIVTNQIQALRQFAEDGSSSTDNDNEQRNGALNPATPLTGPAVSNPRHLRSTPITPSSLVVDHRPLQTLELNTVYRPVVNGKRRSVTRLRQEDLASNRPTRYLLTTQNQDERGRLETKLYKGDVLPTTGGGSQVVFQDVEILRQSDPLAVPSGAVKRDSDGAAVPGSTASAVQHERWKALTGRTGLPAPSSAPPKRRKF